MDRSFQWPPPYTLVHSSRAKYVRLQVCKRRGLRLIVPLGFNVNQVLFILEKHKLWIEKKWIAIKTLTKEQKNAPLPRSIHFKAINETWKIQYRSSDYAFIRLHSEKHTLTLTGNVKNKRLVKHALQKWLKQYAEVVLPPLLETISKETRLHYRSLTIRNARSRWGSCSNEKKISLNAKLLFLTPRLVHHVLLHELCHTVHLNHSKKFWDLLTNFDAQTERYKKELLQASHFVPGWFES